METAGIGFVLFLYKPVNNMTYGVVSKVPELFSYVKTKLN